jgi:hypothetical protein
MSCDCQRRKYPCQSHDAIVTVDPSECLWGVSSCQWVGPGFASVPEVGNTIPGDAQNEVDDLYRRRRAVLLRQRIRRHGIPSWPLRQLLQQVELLRSGPELLRSGPDLLRSDLRRSRGELLRSRRELLRCPVELLPPLELLPPRQGLLPEELLPPFVLPPGQGLLPEELLRSGSKLLRSGPQLLRSGRSDLCRSDLRRSLQLSESVNRVMVSLETITRLDGVQPARRGFL